MTKATVVLALILSFVIGASGSSAAQDAANFLVKWNSNPEPDVTTYIIYRSLDRDNGFTAIDSVSAGTTTYLNSGLTRGVRYYYRVVAKNSSGDRSPLSNPVSGMMIAQNALIAIKNLCRITGIDSISAGHYAVNWSTQDQTIGFVQYDFNWPLDLMSAWDDDQYGLSHAIDISGLLTPHKYYLRAVAYDNAKNMTVSAFDSVSVTGEPTTPLTAPEVSIYPVPFNPGMDHPLTLANLPEGGSVTIYNERGLDVWSSDVDSESPMQWKGVNRQGSHVASGVYYVVIKDSRGSVVEKRPIMVVN